MTDKDFRINLKASGGAAAAKEVEKLVDQLEDTRTAAGAMREALDSIEGEGAQFDAAMERVEQSVAEVEQKIRQADDALEDLSAQQPRAAGATRNTGMAFLELSRAVEDAQYGFRGVINNIPGLVMMLGGSAGLTAAISLAAVAAAQLGPKLFDMARGSDDAADSLANASDQADAAASSVVDYIRALEAADRQRAAEGVTAAADARVQALKAEAEAADLLLQKTRALAAAELERVDAQAGLDLARINAAEGLGQITPAQAAVQRFDVQQRVADAQTNARLNQIAVDQARQEREVQNLRAQLANLGVGASQAAGAASRADAALLGTAGAAGAFARVADLERQVAAATARARAASSDPSGVGVVTQAQAEEIATARREQELLTQELERARAATEGLTQPSERQLEILREQADMTAEIAEAKRQEFEQASAELADAQARLEIEREIADLKRQNIGETADLRRQTGQESTQAIVDQSFAASSLAAANAAAGAAVDSAERQLETNQVAGDLADLSRQAADLGVRNQQETERLRQEVERIRQILANRRD